VSTTVEAFRRIADLPATGLISEEDVKVKVVLPMPRALGYDDADFNYEGRTGRGYVDVMIVERYPTGIVVEAKAPRTKLDQYVRQLETYVFNKHGRDRATVAILMDGELFNIYCITGTLWKGSLEDYRLMSFRRLELGNPVLVPQVEDLLAKQNNQQGAIPEAISAYRKKTQDRLGSIDHRPPSQRIPGIARRGLRCGAFDTDPHAYPRTRQGEVDVRRDRAASEPAYRSAPGRSRGHHTRSHPLTRPRTRWPDLSKLHARTDPRTKSGPAVLQTAAAASQATGSAP
jgi:hypothetical protein